MPETTSSVPTVEYVPVFFSNNNISVSNNSGLVKISDTNEEVIFGPGKLRFIMGPFDNAIKLKFYNVINNKNIPLDLNINASKYRMVFETDSGKISIDNANSQSLENLSTGDLLFKISKDDSTKIVASNSKTVHVTSVAQDGTETLMYSAEWRTSRDRADVDAAISGARQEAEEIISTAQRIAELEAKVEELENANKKLKSQKEKLIPIRNVGKAGIVNKIGMKSPKKVSANSGNLDNSSIR
jgi:hypothetical protein